MPLAWIASKPAATSWRIDSASAGGSGPPLRIRWESVSPSMNSMVRNAPSGASKNSKIRQTLGWVTRRASTTSRRSRSSADGSPASSRRIIFRATTVPSERSRASKTSPMPPAPMPLRILNRRRSVSPAEGTVSPAAPGIEAVWRSSVSRLPPSASSCRTTPGFPGRRQAPPCRGSARRCNESTLRAACPGLLPLTLSGPDRGVGLQRLQEVPGHVSDLVHRVLECHPVGGGRRSQPAHLPDVLERSRLDLLGGRRRLEVVQDADVAAHAGGESTSGAPLARAPWSALRSSSQRGKRATTAHRKRLVDAGDLLPAEPDAGGRAVLPDARDLRRLGNAEDVRIAGQEGQGHLVRRHSVRSGDLRQHLSAARRRAGVVARPVGAVPHHCYVVLPAPGQHPVLDVP